MAFDRGGSQALCGAMQRMVIEQANRVPLLW
jgi:hypothetical protein